jgi:hypothetical protein
MVGMDLEGSSGTSSKQFPGMCMEGLRRTADNLSWVRYHFIDVAMSVRLYAQRTVTWQVLIVILTVMISFIWQIL